ncbi:MAG TPA: hypothetical protein PLC52_02340 [Anaerolineales bacterium]|nr:hypothetical protein [Anaerolineales bacterium]HRQ91693.1 hypothetical protein [Anaerolineales bacterium]
MSNNQIDLGPLFSQVVKTLAQQQSQLNKADTQNHDHGDNMVQVFNTITEAIEQKQGSSQTSQLGYAAELLAQQNSGSAQLYAKGLQQAAQQFKGSEIDASNILQLIQLLMGGGQAAPSAAPSGAGALGTLLTQLAGGQSASSADDDKINMQDILNAGLTYMTAKNAGASTGEALIKALVADSAMAPTPHRAQSSELVLKTLLDVVGRMGGK